MLRAWQILRPPILNDSAPRQPIDVKIPQAPERRTSRAERDWLRPRFVLPRFVLVRPRFVLVRPRFVLVSNAAAVIGSESRAGSSAAPPIRSACAVNRSAVLVFGNAAK